MNYAKWEGYQWCYSKSFVAPQLKPGQQYQLFFAGIDCLAGYIWLNGKHIGKAENMMIEHAFDVTKEIKSRKKQSTPSDTPFICY